MGDRNRPFARTEFALAAQPHRRAFQILVLLCLLAGLVTGTGSIEVSAQSNSPTVAWVDSELPLAATHQPASFYHPNLHKPTVYRNWKGTYTVRFPGLTFDGGNVQAEALSADTNCSVTTWHGELLGVQCFDANGWLVDSRFTATYSEDRNAAWVMGTETTKPELYNANTRYSNNPSGGRVTIDRNYRGGYNVRFHGYDLSAAEFQVSAVLSNAECQVSNISGENLGVHCYDANGRRVDSRFTAAQRLAPDRSVKLSLIQTRLNGCRGGTFYPWGIENRSVFDSGDFSLRFTVQNEIKEDVTHTEVQPGPYSVPAGDRRDYAACIPDSAFPTTGLYDVKIEVLPHSAALQPSLDWQDRNI